MGQNLPLSVTYCFAKTWMFNFLSSADVIRIHISIVNHLYENKWQVMKINKTILKLKYMLFSYIWQICVRVKLWFTKTDSLTFIFHIAYMYIDMRTWPYPFSVMLYVHKSDYGHFQLSHQHGHDRNPCKVYAPNIL